MYSTCSIVFKEIVSCNSEIPDVVGFNMHTSILIECKADRADFLSDKKKFFRRNNKYGMGQYRFYLVNDGIVSEEEIPEGWGLLVAKSNSIHIIKDSHVFDYSEKSEKRFLISLLRRISFWNMLDILNDTKIRPLEYEYDVDDVDKSEV